MGKLNIAHHKSYHPYRRDNIDRVRRDEEEAAQKEAREEGRVLLADSEARIDLLRGKAGLGGGSKVKGKEKETIKEITGGTGSLTGSGGHINFFEDLEQTINKPTILRSTKSKKSDPVETEKGVPLAPSAKDLKPWYVTNGSEKEHDGEKEKEGWDGRTKRDRDLAFKALNDPLTAITHQLAARSHAHSSSPSSQPSKPQLHLLPRPPRSNARPARPSNRDPPDTNTTPTPSQSILTSRLHREFTERERALALIARKKREMEGSETPSTVHGGDYGGYTDVFNRREVEEAHRGWGRSARDYRDRDREQRDRRDRQW